MSNREILQQAATVFRDQYPTLNAEAVIAFFIIADQEEPTVDDISLAIGLHDMQVFQYMAPLRNAGLVSLQTEDSGVNRVLLTGRGEEAKQAIMGLLTG